MGAPILAPLLVLMVVVVVICQPARMLRKRALLRALEETNARIYGAAVRDLSPGELAFLHRGPRQTMLAGLAEAAGNSAPPPDTLAAVIKRHLDSGTASPRELNKEAEPYLRAVTDRLSRLGLIVPREVLGTQRRIGQRVRWAYYLLAAVFVVYCLAAKGDIPLLSQKFLIPVGFGVLWAVLWPPHRRMPRLHSAAAGRLAERSEKTYDYLAPHHRPAYSSYGPEATAFATAVFGAAVLHDAYPALAESPLAAELMSLPRNASGDVAGFSCGSYGEDGDKACSAGCNSDSGCGSGGCGGGD